MIRGNGGDGFCSYWNSLFGTVKAKVYIADECDQLLCTLGTPKRMASMDFGAGILK